MSKFIEILAKHNKLEPGQRNCSAPFIVKVAKTFKLEEKEMLEQLREEGGWDLTKIDEKTLHNAWMKFEPDEKYVHVKKLELKPIEVEDNFELLRYFWKKDEAIWIGQSTFSGNIAKLEDWTSLDNIEDEHRRKFRLKDFEFMSIASFKDEKSQRSIENAACFKYWLVESDNLSLEDQEWLISEMINFGLPIKSVVFSGNKSYHVLLKGTPTNDLEKWRKDAATIFRTLELLSSKVRKKIETKFLFDPAGKNPVELTRLPLGQRTGTSDIRQDLVFLDFKDAEEDDWSTYSSTPEKVKEFVKKLLGNNLPLDFDEELEKGNFKQIGNEVKSAADFAIDFSDKDCPIDDIFYNGKDLYASFKDERGLMQTKMSVVSGAIVPYIKPDVKKALERENPTIDKETKEKKPSKFSLSMLDIPIKSFTFKMTLNELTTMKNSYEPGFITEAVKDICNECPSEFEKLLDNLADDKCKKWLVNHLACYFWLLKHDFQRNGGLYVLQTVPVFVGPQGTGKTTLAMIIGNAICKDGYRDVSLEQLSNAQFNDFFESGCMAVNEVGATSLERKANRNALKRWTDPKVTVNKKHIVPYTIDNTAYKLMTANSSVYGVLSLDQGENRRWQYIEGGKGKRAEEVIDFELLEQQKVDFFSWILSLKPNFNEAQQVFDTETKLQDLALSKPKVEVVAEWLEEWLRIHEDWPGFTVKGVKLAYEDETGERTDAVTNRALSLLLSKRYGKPKQIGKPLTLYKETLSRGSCYWPNPYFKENGQNAGLSIPLDLRLDPDET